MRCVVGLLFACVLLGCGAARPAAPVRAERVVVTVAPADPDAVLDVEAIAADRAALIEALEEAYAGRRFVTDETFATMLERLDRLDVHTSGELCLALSGILSRLIDPGISVSLDDLDARCHVAESTVGGLPHAGTIGGDNLAHGAGPLFVLEEDPGETPLAVLAIRAFAPADDPGWAGLDEAIARLAAAPAIVIDLRGAAGHDARPLVPLLTALIGDLPAPLAEVIVSTGELADTLRANAELLGLRETFDLGALAPFLSPLGEGLPTPPFHDISILIDDGCGEACELVTRVLTTHAHALVTGTAGYRHRLPIGGPGVLVLPRSHVRVTLPLRAVVVSDAIAHITGDRVYWHDRHRFGAGDTAEVVPNFLPGLRAGTRDRASLRARIAGWLATPIPDCAALRPASHAALPPARRSDLASTFHFDRGSRTATIYVSLPPDAARSFVSSCPDLHVRSVHALAPPGLDDTGVVVAFDTLDDLARLLNVDFVRAIQVDDPEPADLEPDLDAE